MSNSNLAKSVSYSHSPNISKVNRVHIRQIYCSPPKILDQPNPKVKLSDSLSRFPKKIVNLSKFSNKNTGFGSTSFLSQVKDQSENHSFADLEASSVGIEKTLKKKLKKESNFVKKLEIVVATFEKLSNLNRNFSIFSSVIGEFLAQTRDQLILAADKEDKSRENDLRFKELTSKYEDLTKDLQKALTENKALKENLEELKGKEKILKITSKRQSLLLQKLQNAGYPVEKFHESLLKPGNKSKSMNKISIVASDEEKRPNSIPIASKLVPKLKFPQHEGSEGYQEEFMSKFNEFSESWRKQIMKDHHIVNK